MLMLIGAFTLSFSYDKGFKWKKVKLSDDVTISAPKPHNLSEYRSKRGHSLRYFELETKLSVNASYTHSPMHMDKRTILVESEEALKEYYDQQYNMMPKGPVSHEGPLRYIKMDSDVYKIGNILVHRSVGSAFAHRTHKYFETHTFILKGEIYRFSVQHLYEEKDNYKELREKFFSSIKIDKNLGIEDQFLD